MWGMWLGIYVILGGCLLVYVGLGLRKRTEELVRREVLRDFFAVQPDDAMTRNFVAMYEQMWAKQDSESGHMMDEIQFELGKLREALGGVGFALLVAGLGTFWLPLVLYYHFTEKNDAQ